MSRLIDADKLMEELIEIESNGGIGMYFIAFEDLIKEQPTAFDVDKVVSELEKSHFHTESTFDDFYCNDDSEEVVNLNEAIEIVKAGGIDE